MKLFNPSRQQTLLFLLLLLPSLHAWCASAPQPTIAIIIDDMGNHFDNGSQLITLPYPLTLSFLPERKHTHRLSKLARVYNKEVMLHSPMENTLGIALGQGGLTESMSEQQIKKTLAQSLKSVPYIVGVNNHMGSKLTTHPGIMNWVMEELSHHPFYFVDSKTSAQSIAAQSAQKHGIPTLTRDIFLDHEQNQAFIQKQFTRLIDIARKKGTAIAIGHPHRVTIDYLKNTLPKLGEQGISIATISSLWQIKHPAQRMFSNHPGKQFN